MQAHSTLIGGSSAERIIHCTRSAILSQQVPRKSVSTYANEGSMLHNIMETVLTKEGAKVAAGHVENTVARYVDKFEAHGHTFTNDLAVEMVYPAFDFFYQLKTKFGGFDFVSEARVAYEKSDAFGTCDIIGSNENYTFLIDWKFGRGVAVSAHGNNQLLFYAGAARETSEFKDMFSPDKKIVLAIIQPGVINGDPFTYEIIDHATLDYFVHRMREALSKIAQKQTSFNAGTWCRWCPALAICPVKKSTAQELIRKGDCNGLNSAELGDLVEKATAFESWSRAVMTLAHDALEKGHKVTGFKLVQKRGSRQWRDTSTAIALFKKLRLRVTEFTVKKCISPTQAEKLFKTKNRDISPLKELIVSTSSGTTIAPEKDKRPAISSTVDSERLNLPVTH